MVLPLRTWLSRVPVNVWLFLHPGSSDWFRTMSGSACLRSVQKAQVKSRAGVDKKGFACQAVGSTFQRNSFIHSIPRSLSF